MTITVRELLYFEKPTTRTTFSHIPNGSPDISRMLDGRPAYPSTETVSLKMPKTIIVDLRARDLKFLQQRAFDQKIQEFQREGLAIYYYQDERLCEYNLAIIDDAKRTDPFPSAAQLIKTLGIPVDELFILDHQYADLVISGYDAQFLPDLSEIISFRPRQAISSLFINSPAPLSEIDALLHNFPQIERLFLNAEQASKEIEQDIVNWRVYKRLSTLKTLDLDLSGSRLTSPQLAACLEAQNPKILKLKDCKFITAPFQRSVNFSSLEQPDLSKSAISSTSLARIAQQTLQLKVLNLNDCKNITDPFPEALRLPELEALNISNCSMKASYVIQILSNAKKLKILTCNVYRQINDLRLDGLMFPVLEELNFRGCPVNKGNFVHFISISPILSRLNLAFCENIEGDLPDGLNFSGLKELDISHSSLSDLSIARILTQTKELKSLVMSNLQISMDMPSLHLTQLAILHLDQCNIPTAMLTDLLEKGTQLRHLNLAFCENINEAITENATFPKLTHIGLSFSNITGDTLYMMLSMTAQLTRLMLDNCKYITHLPGELKLAELENLHLNGLNISDDTLLKLIANSPKLKLLECDGCKNLSIALIKDLQQRPGLTIIKPVGEPERTESGVLGFFASPHPVASQGHRQTTRTVGADTEATYSYSVDRIFMGKPHAPQPRDLRYETFDDFELDDQAGIKAPFRLEHQAPELAACADISAQHRATQPLNEKYLQCGDRHYFCRTNLQPTPEWQALPSAFADETLINFYTEPPVEVELVKSPHTNLHYIRSTTQASQPVILEMLLTRPQPTIGFVDLPQAIRDLAHFCRGFRQEALKDVAPTATAQTFLDALIAQRVGACRHRSIVFMHLMKTKYPGIPVRLVGNPLHMFAEVSYQDR